MSEHKKSYRIDAIMRLSMNKSTTQLRRKVCIRLLEAKYDRQIRANNPKKTGYPFARKFESELRDLLNVIDQHDALLNFNSFTEQDTEKVYLLKLEIEHKSRALSIAEKDEQIDSTNRKPRGAPPLQLEEKIELAWQYARIHRDEPSRKPKDILTEIRPMANSCTTENYRNLLLVGIDAIIELGEATEIIFTAREHIPGGGPIDRSIKRIGVTPSELNKALEFHDWHQKKPTATADHIIHMEMELSNPPADHYDAICKGLLVLECVRNELTTIQSARRLIGEAR